MHHSKKISAQKLNNLLPVIERKLNAANICMRCDHVNKTKYLFCTNCGYPLHDKFLEEVYYKNLKARNELLFKAENAVLIARIILYVMAAFLLCGILFIFSESSAKYLIAMLALIMSGLFFFLAFWSRNNPLSGMLTAFMILITFSAIDIFGKLKESLTTKEGFIGVIICISLLIVVLKGVKGAYRITLLKQELQN